MSRDIFWRMRFFVFFDVFSCLRIAVGKIDGKVRNFSGPDWRENVFNGARWVFRASQCCFIMSEMVLGAGSGSDMGPVGPKMGQKVDFPGTPKNPPEHPRT